MRPYRVGYTSISLSFAGIDHVHLIHFLITIPVVVGEVHFAVGSLAGFYDHGCWMLVVAFFAIQILAIIRHIVGHGVGSHHIEFEIKLAPALVVEIVVNGAYEVAIIKMLFVGQAFKVLFGVGILEFHILEVDEDNDTLFLSLDTVARAFLCLTFCHSLGPISIGTLTTFLGSVHHFLTVDHLEKTCFIFLIGITVAPQPEMSVLITYKTGSNGLAIGQR